MAATKKSARPSQRKRSSEPRGRDAIAYLKDEHSAIERDFKKFEGLGPGAVKTRQKTADSIIERLSKHAEIEEQVLYPVARDRSSDLAGQIVQALEEHHVVKLTLAELTRTKPDDERFVAKMNVLIENVRHHVDEEETDFFPKIREAFTRKELELIGAHLAEARKTAASRPHPHAPDTPPANIAANLLSGPLDSMSRIVDSARRSVS